MKQPLVSTLIEQDFTSAEKALGRHNIDAISSADLEGYATQEWVQDQNYITSADLPDVSDMATKTWTNENFYSATNPSGFLTSADIPDMSQYATHEELESAIESATSGKMDSSEASAFYPRYENPEGYITSGDLPDFHVYSAGQYVNIEGDTINVTGVYPDTNPSGFATSSWVVEQNYITSADVPGAQEYSAGQYVSITDHVVSVTGLQPEGDYLTSADVSGFVDVNYVENNFYSASNPSGFLTSADIPDLSDYATIQYVDNSINSATSGKQDKLTFGYTDDKISSINSSAIYSTGGGSEIYRKPYGGSETFVSAMKINSDDPDGYAYVTADEVGQGYLVSGPYKKLLDAGINSGYGVGDSATPIFIDNDGTFKPVSATFTQEQSDWAENDNTQVDYIKNKPTPVSLEAISPLYITDELSASKIGIYSSAFPDMSYYATKEYVDSATSGFPIMTGVGLKAGAGITLTDETSAVMISSNVPYPTVECQAISVDYSAYVKAVYPQSSACCELHVSTPHRYDAVAEYSAKIDDDGTWAIPSGSWYDFIKQDFDGTKEWCFKDSGQYYA